MCHSFCSLGFCTLKSWYFLPDNAKENSQKLEKACKRSRDDDFVRLESFCLFFCSFFLVAWIEFKHLFIHKCYIVTGIEILFRFTVFLFTFQPFYHLDLKKDSETVESPSYNAVFKPQRKVKKNSVVKHQGIRVKTFNVSTVNSHCN